MSCSHKCSTQAVCPCTNLCCRFERKSEKALLRSPAFGKSGIKLPFILNPEQNTEEWQQNGLHMSHWKSANFSMSPLFSSVHLNWISHISEKPAHWTNCWFRLQRPCVRVIAFMNNSECSEVDGEVQRSQQAACATAWIPR